MTNILYQKFLAFSSMNKLENTLGPLFVFSPKTSRLGQVQIGESLLCHFRSVILWTGHNWIWTLTHSAINKRKLYSICKSPNCVFTHQTLIIVDSRSIFQLRKHFGYVQTPYQNLFWHWYSEFVNYPLTILYGLYHMTHMPCSIQYYIDHIIWRKGSKRTRNISGESGF